MQCNDIAPWTIFFVFTFDFISIKIIDVEPFYNSDYLTMKFIVSYQDYLKRKQVGEQNHCFW